VSNHRCSVQSTNTTRIAETTAIYQFFGGYLESTVCCQACGYQSRTYDATLDFSLEIDSGSPQKRFGKGKKFRGGRANAANNGAFLKAKSLHHALAHFTRKETLDGGKAAWRCEGKCNRTVVASKQLVCSTFVWSHRA